MYNETPAAAGGGRGRLRPSERWLYLAILVLAVALRLPALPAALPYIGYVDEGHVLHQVTHMLAHRTWDAGFYYYPPLPASAIALTSAALSPLYRAAHGRPLAEDLSPAAYDYYDFVAPAELLVVGRALTLLFSLGTVLLTGLFARRLAGREAGLFAALAAALLPALVLRSAIVVVDTWAAFFAVAALAAAEVCRQGGRRPAAMAALAGVLAGLAAAAKYPTALVCLPVGLAVLLSPGGPRVRLTRLALAAGAAALTALAAMPALWLRTGAVVHDLTGIAGNYRLRLGSYADQLLHRAEWDLPYDHPEAGLPFLALAAAGLLWGLCRRRTAPAIAGFLLFAGALAVLFAPYPFRVLRNFLSLAPLASVGAGLALAWVREKLSRPRLFDAVAVAALLALFVPPLARHARARFLWQDSRHRAIVWLEGQMRPGERLVVAGELAVLPAELARLPGQRAAVMPLYKTWRRLRLGNTEWALIGFRPATVPPRLPPRMAAAILDRYVVAAAFGRMPIPASPKVGRGNRVKVFVLKKKEEEGLPGRSLP